MLLKYASVYWKQLDRSMQSSFNLADVITGDV
jgi:hypothetical protein